MKSFTKLLAINILVSIFLFSANLVYSQTSGTLTFSCKTYAPNGTWGKEHALAVWIENAQSPYVFIKTKAKYGSDVDHLTSWTAKSNKNLVDAVTGATLRNYDSTVTTIWNATNISGTVVADGTYKVFIEMGWGSNKTNDHSVSSFSFTKIAKAVYLTPTGTTNYSNIVIYWTPNTIDTIAPTIPTNLTSSNITKTGFTLSWTASTDNIALMGYIIYKDNDSLTTVTTNSANITGLTQGSTYSFSVMAKDFVGGVSPKSTPLSVTTLSELTPNLINRSQTDNVSYIYPNPTNGILNLEVRNMPPSTLIIENVLGVVIYQKKIEKSYTKVLKIDLSLVPNGLYLMKVNSSNQKLVYKVFVKR